MHSLKNKFRNAEYKILSASVVHKVAADNQMLSEESVQDPYLTEPTASQTLDSRSDVAVTGQKKQSPAHKSENTQVHAGSNLIPSNNDTNDLSIINNHASGDAEIAEEIAHVKTVTIPMKNLMCTNCTEKDKKINELETEVKLLQEEKKKKLQTEHDRLEQERQRIEELKEILHQREKNLDDEIAKWREEKKKEEREMLQDHKNRLKDVEDMKREFVNNLLSESREARQKMAAEFEQKNSLLIKENEIWMKEKELEQRELVIDNSKKMQIQQQSELDKTCSDGKANAIIETDHDHAQD